MDSSLYNVLLEDAIYCAKEIRVARGLEEGARESLSTLCQQLHQAGASDRKIAEATGFSRARIQQLRTGNG